MSCQQYHAPDVSAQGLALFHAQEDTQNGRSVSVSAIHNMHTKYHEISNNYIEFRASFYNNIICCNA
jgi:hypothetical protein